MTDKQEIVLEEKINLIEKEVATLTRKVEELSECLGEFEDLRFKISGLKLFLGREYPGIVQKVSRKTCLKSPRPARK
jgi:hypothetical protein